MAPSNAVDAIIEKAQGKDTLEEDYSSETSNEEETETEESTTNN